MTTPLAWWAVILGAVVGMLLAVTLVGWLLPRQHIASRTLLLANPPETVWATLIDFPAQVNWRSELTGVVRQPDQDGGAVWRELDGRNAVQLRTTTAISPSRLPSD